MSYFDRAASGIGGSPSTLGTPLSDNGLNSPGSEPRSLSAHVTTTVLKNNTILSSLTYREKLQTLYTLFGQSASESRSSATIYLVSPATNIEKIRDDLYSSFKVKARCYVPTGPSSRFNHTWFEDLRNELAIIPVPIMLLALDRGLVDLSEPSHLIIDDAHSIALDDLSAPLATILLEYYGKLPAPRRPHILGFTHYPLELEANFGYLALRMEQLLDAQLLGNLNARRQEIATEATRLPVSVLEYEFLRPQAISTLTEEERHPAFKATLDEIGECCSPLLRCFNFDSDPKGIIESKYSAGIPLPDPTTGTTPKFNALLKYLRSASQTPNFRCVVIANNPFIVLSIEWLLSSYQQSGIRSSVYLDHLEVQHPYGTRDNLIDAFANGSVNTLVCNDTILGGLDGDICSHVIWFNPYGSLIAFAQSRLLARRTGASLVLLAEQNNREHYRAARDVLCMEPAVTSWMLAMDVEGAPVPPTNLANCPRFGPPPIILRPSREGTLENPYIMDPVSGSRICPNDSEEVLYRFLAAQSSDHHTVLPVKVFSYTSVSVDEILWRCTINATFCNPPLNVSGEPSSCKAIARGSACFRACSALFNLDLLSSTFFPLRPQHSWQHGILQHKKASGIPNGHYPFVFPLFWHNCLLAAPSKLFYPTIVEFAAISGSTVYKNMILLTRRPLHGIEEFSMFDSQVEFKARLHQYTPLILDTEHMELIFRYTIHLWRILTNKPFESPSGELAYFVAPIRADLDLKPDSATRTSVETFISWKEIDDLTSSRVRSLNCANPDEMSSSLLAGVIQDRSHEFTRRFEYGKLRTDLNPLSLIMQEREAGPYISLLEYYRTHRHQFEGIKDLNQPLIEATLLPGLANHLDPKDTPVERTQNYLVPEMCFLSSIPSSTFHTASLMPSVIWHIENVLVSRELNLTFFQGQIREELLMHALCSQTARRTFNYERLEFLGDTFIKYAASAYLYVTEPGAAAGSLHTRRQKMVNNRSLWQGAQALGLPLCIQSEPFRPKLWAIPNASSSNQNRAASSGDQVPANRVNVKLSSRQIVPKAIADVVEAIIGAALLSGGEKLAFSSAKIMGFDVPRACDWLDVVSHTHSKSIVSQEPRNDEILQGIMSIVGVSLESPEILLQAMHHPSLTSLSESYERLEFLGDAVLDMLVVQSFFSDEEKWSPHNMTLIKSSMVSNRALAVICVESGLHRFLMHDAPHLTKHIKSFVEEIEACKQEAKTDSQRLKYWSTLQAPKALGDVVESLLGAIYVSAGFRLSRVKIVYDRLLGPFYDRYIDKKAILSHPMSQLMKKVESAGCRALGLVKTSLPSTSGNGFVTKFKIHGRVIAGATSERPKKAITLATEEAINRLELEFNDLMSNCTCKNMPQGKKRKRMPIEEGEILEPLPGDDADHPIDVDMFDF